MGGTQKFTWKLETQEYVPRIKITPHADKPIDMNPKGYKKFEKMNFNQLLKVQLTPQLVLPPQIPSLYHSIQELSITISVLQRLWCKSAKYWRGMIVSEMWVLKRIYNLVIGNTQSKTNMHLDCNKVKKRSTYGKTSTKTQQEISFHSRGRLRSVSWANGKNNMFSFSNKM